MLCSSRLKRQSLTGETTMAIFKHLNSKIEKSSYDITIQNIDASNDHWGNEKDITQFLGEIEGLSYDKDNFDKNLVKHSLAIINYNPRTEDMIFYKQGRNIVLLTIADRRSFSDVEWLSRRLEINLKRQGFSFIVIEVLKKEYEEVAKGTKTLPETWVLDEDLNKRLSRMKNFVNAI
jgi:hypothetical protein